ncbi:hypothetical protein HS088_TW12G00724 [Tripterygium wilfordii]|uniref:Uncharacterized protein n=1 Tax=Tripterygium wilfordii TaxID=458696 RepID=A0A7J7CZQ9_TRIWF|nr:hypothetical protein HS088_TW12G00724 [Tripterygium wilfordii]
MSGHGYMHRGRYSADSGGSPPKKDYWNKTYDSDSDDHLCRPVIVDAEGKKRPIISYGPNYHNTEGYVTKTETIVEHVYSPHVSTDYRHSSPSKVYPVKAYSIVEERRHRTSSPVHDRPHKVEEFITNVPTDASRPNKYGNPGTTHWRQNHNSTGNHGNNGYGGNTIRDDNYDNDYYHDSKMKPRPMPSNNGWARPNHVTSSPPDAPLSKVTNNIESAVEYLKEAAKPFSSTSTTAAAARHSRYKEPEYSETIDSREASRRYGKPNVSSQAYSKDDAYKPTIDSREAMRKYHGTVI